MRSTAAASCCFAVALALAAPAHDALAQQPIDAPILKPFADNRQWLLVEDVRYTVGTTAVTVTVPSGFVTDFASIPQAFWSLGLSPNGRYSKAAIVHDYLYWSQSCSRLQSDNLLLIAMKESHVDAGTRDTIYSGVRVGGDGSWNGNARERRDHLPRVVPRELRSFGPDVLWADYRQDLRGQGVEDPVFPTDPEYCRLGDGTDVPRP